MSSYGANYTHEKIREDIRKMVQAELSDNAIYAILHDIAWAWTEQRDIEVVEDDKRIIKSKRAKLKGCVYWTKNAFEKAFYKNSKGEWIPHIEKEFNIKEKLIHEHIVPKIIYKKTIANYFAKGKINDKIDTIIDAMEKNLIGCVVTKEEADMLDHPFKETMPNPEADCDFCEITDAWARYKKTAQKNPQFSKKIYKLKWESPKSKNGSWKFISAEEYLNLLK